MAVQINVKYAFRFYYRDVYEGMLNEVKDVVGNLGDERMRSC